MLTYNDFLEACEVGDLETVNRALEIEEIKTNAAAQANEAFNWAFKHLHGDVIKRLLEV